MFYSNVLKFYVKTINPENAKENLENWIDENWSEIAEYEIKESEMFRWTNLPTNAKNFSRN